MYEQIFQELHVIRGASVILDRDLAACLGLSTKRLNEQVKRHASRFPSDFRFQLSNEEFLEVSRPDRRVFMRGGRRYIPYAYTEAGALMAVLVVKTPAANEMSIDIIKDLLIYWSQFFPDDPPFSTPGNDNSHMSTEPDEDLESCVRFDRLIGSVLATTRRWRADLVDAAEVAHTEVGPGDGRADPDLSGDGGERRNTGAAPCDERSHFAAFAVVHV